MALKVEVVPHELDFLFEAGTSRGVLKNRKVWYVKVLDEDKPEVIGWGEAGPLSGLSIDDVPDFELRLQKAIDNLQGKPFLYGYSNVAKLVAEIPEKLPSVRFGMETALLDLLHGGQKKIFENDFFANGQPIQINGLVWMGDKDLMMSRLEEKIEQGFRCIKVKIGAIDFESEMKLLQAARSRFSAKELELRVDANGAFEPNEAINVLERLKELEVHSIEQPIKAGEVLKMRSLCATTPVPIALDEELIGYTTYAEKYWLIKVIQPQYIILKPSLVGGFAASKEWIEVADEFGVGWWITSALESNIGLNAISQFASSLNVTLPQGLGTGGLYQNNIASPLTISGDKLFYDNSQKWGQVIK
ncbi:MAG: o-succinylbenzoate synthase [Cyclobacteriaceae bacterium]|nr:o-succinylbenzoate synthase [Cyclobacteriaceae bacterium]